jgi:hypothetical protein
MHHVAGWATLALSGSLFAYALFPKRAEKLKWVGPALLLIGGVFLFFFADRDLYPRFTDFRQLRDREVQLHKTLSIILVVVGGIGIRRLWRPRLQSAAAITTENLTAPAGISTPSKAVAVMALIGGGMLFTHVHTVAPYANVAAGVYIAHITMGLVALGIGATRLLQDALPRWRHGLAVMFAVLMCAESVLLITYNEGLPWYIGYGAYNRWGVYPDGTRDPHSPIAPFGAIRAQLTFNPTTQQLDVYVKSRFTEASAPVPAREIDLLISRGYNETAVPMLAQGHSDLSAHFQAVAPFLKNASMFCARVALPVGSSMKMGYFDPWVSALINPVPPNELAKYQCPMHDGIISEKPGNCPLCGMPLVPILLTPRMDLHDADYDMRLETSPGPLSIEPGAPVKLRFIPRYHGRLLRDLALVHEHLFHLIIVSSDLIYFDHVHPVMQADGSLTLDYIFPKSGTYLMFADITPQGQRSQVFRLPVIVHDPGANAQLMADLPILTPTVASARMLADDPTETAELIFQPRTPVAGLHTDFLFRLTRDGRPVNDLQPYIGAMGHCVIISQDTQTYLHCHPEQLLAPTPDARGGPDVPFHTIFPRPGLYKIWGQFKRGNHVVIADFVVDVKSSILPPRVINFLLDD